VAGTGGGDAHKYFAGPRIMFWDLAQLAVLLPAGQLERFHLIPLFERSGGHGDGLAGA